MNVIPHLTIEELEALNAAQTKPRAWRRFRGVVLATRGEPADRIADALGRSVRAVQKWVARYNAGGAEALAEQPGRGRKPRFPAAEHDRLRARIEAGPTPEDGTCAFHARDIRRILRDEFQVELSEDAVYDLLHRLGLSSLMPRPIHRKTDLETQEAFKKGLPSGSTRSLRPTPTTASRSGSPTKRGSANKGR